ncbi:unnamed protein product [Cylicostephanus goldi]|uniref:EF-hand domain-containing protein n=1 Tax=Cylicostephanus goldi TaxID=71465 RepID=A0A3P7MSG7_CYLGO|nr:unnamed protein product [Cylicostephanus goldi]
MTKKIFSPLEKPTRRKKLVQRTRTSMNRTLQECPSGRMREHEFRHVLSAIISPERATDQYIARLFLAFSSDDKKTITFQNLIECLSLIQPQTAESNARWTIRIITGCQTDRFAFPEFLTFTQAVFGLNEGKPGEFTEDSNGNRDKNKESVEHRATTIFNVSLLMCAAMEKA